MAYFEVPMFRLEQKCQCAKKQPSVIYPVTYVCSFALHSPFTIHRYEVSVAGPYCSFLALKTFYVPLSYKVYQLVAAPYLMSVQKKIQRLHAYL